jgi:hypothetical protein
MTDKKFNIIATVGIIITAIFIGSITFYETSREEIPSPTAAPREQDRIGKLVATSTILYTNNDYGFTFTLPENWKGYSLVVSKWIGQGIGDTQDAPRATGPLIAIRSPLWTSEVPRQDIPIMVFTLREWDELRREVFHIGAAPIPPSELGRNANYVFALPARYNYAFPAGFEEVQAILEGRPLHTF